VLASAVSAIQAVQLSVLSHHFTITAIRTSCPVLVVG
jgi:hypothetical protein